MSHYEQHAKILLVDDRYSNLLVLEAILEPLGHELVHAQSGEEALKQLLMSEFALILLDVQMPGMNGLETAALIKQRAKTRHIPMIFITAVNNDRNAMGQGYTAGAVDYLAKPIDPDILRSKVTVFVELFLKEKQIQHQAEMLKASAQREVELRLAEREHALEQRHMAELAEAAVRLEEFKASLDATLDGIRLFDPETLRYFYANQGALQELQYSEEEMMQLRPIDVFPEFDEDQFRNLLAPLMDGTQKSHTFETQQRRKNGTLVPVEVFVQFIQIDGQPGRFVSIVRDITERKQAELALAEAYAKEKRITEVLQRSLLLTPPGEAFPGLSIASIYQAAWDEASVGGDFFDVFAVDDNNIALVIGDVTGKGLVAAARTAEVKYVLRAFLRESCHPGLALSRLNTILIEGQRLDDSNSDAFICLTAVVINTKQHEATFAVAGTEPPLIIRHNGPAETVNNSGLPLGITVAGPYETTRMCFEEGDTILLLTDGITEARNGDELYNYDRMVEHAQESLKHSGLQEAGHALLKSAQEFAGGKLQDDACLLLARCLPSANTFENANHNG